jgi:UDP-N-acetylmuramate dehydrogenase
MYINDVARNNNDGMALLIETNFSLRSLNTFGIDAKAKAYFRVTCVDDLRAIRQRPDLMALPRLVLGGGSNLLLTGDFPGLVLHICLQGIALDPAAQADANTKDAIVRAAAGESWHALVQWTLARGLGGLENLSLIPGTVGAAPIQNIGAYGAEIKDTLHALTVFDFDSGEVVTMDRAECEFGYRDSVFKHRLRERVVILDVSFSLPFQWQANLRYAELAQALTDVGVSAATPQQISAAVIAIRRRKLPDPAQIGNAGSFFKNPVLDKPARDALLARYPQLVSYAQADGSYKLAAGWLIDQCGWKGKSLGRAGVYAQQALVLVNHGGASGAEIVQLAQVISTDVQARFGVVLEPEPVLTSGYF